VTADHRDPGLLIRLSRGSGQGPTKMAAFDAALRSAGMQGYNLVRLSSVIPVGARVRIVNGAEQLTGDFGDAVFCVYAEAYADRPGASAWAGIAWSLRTDGSEAGLFVEQSGPSQEVVERGLITTLTAMDQGRAEDFELAGRLIGSIECVTDPVAAVVIATYRRMGWAGSDADWHSGPG